VRQVKKAGITPGLYASRLAGGTMSAATCRKRPVSSEGEPSLSSSTDMAPVKAQNLLSSAKNLSEQDRKMLGGEADLTA
jgi:hypothetical protein